MEKSNSDIFNIAYTGNNQNNLFSKNSSLLFQNIDDYNNEENRNMHSFFAKNNNYMGLKNNYSQLSLNK
jgi:hypothetical protein